MELGVSHVLSLSSLTPIVDNIFDKYNNKKLVPIRSLSDHDKQMAELTVMSKRLTPPPNTSQVTKEARKVPDLETLTKALKDKHPSESLPNMEICAKIGDVFSKLAAAHKAYREATDGLAELSTELSPPHYTMMLMAVVMTMIQVVIPGNLVSPVAAPPPPQAAASKALGRSEIITYTKLKVLPDPVSPELMAADKNSTTHVLVTAIYLKVEHLFFDETSSRMDVATAFCCNLSQLTKAVHDPGSRNCAVSVLYTVSIVPSFTSRV